jgi:hypothetical protein
VRGVFLHALNRKCGRLDPVLRKATRCLWTVVGLGLAPGLVLGVAPVWIRVWVWVWVQV